MADEMVLGIDCGGTHTDAALLAIDRQGKMARLVASAKTLTRRDALLDSVSEILGLVLKGLARDEIKAIGRVTLGTTLEVNALVEHKADKVGLALSAGPGLNPDHFIIGDCYCIVPGGLDHRGEEVGRIDLHKLEKALEEWPAKGVKAIACIGKFSPRNPWHEIQMAELAGKMTDLPVSVGHKLSGRLNFPRRIATTYYNAAVHSIHCNFIDAVETAFEHAGLDCPAFLLKADGGAIPFASSRKEPVQSILSGPAASVMGLLAMAGDIEDDCTLLLDIGGTTTDLAVIYKGSPVLDRKGMRLEGRHTLVRSLACSSIGIGGDSLLKLEKKGQEHIITVGPEREGPAMAFGGKRPTLLDALNTLDLETQREDSGNCAASMRGLEDLANSAPLSLNGQELASAAVEYALAKIAEAEGNLLGEINSSPIYTLAALRAAKAIEPGRAWLVGGPAKCLRERLEKSLHKPVQVGAHFQVANAIGAALSTPAASLEIYADTGKGRLTAPALDYEERISRNFTLEDARTRACELLEAELAKSGLANLPVEVVEADIFAVLDDYGHGSFDMRVSAQVVPGIAARLE